MSPTIASPGTGTRSSTEDQITPLFNVVLLDDDEHTYDYVIEMLGKLFFLGPEAAYRHAVEKQYRFYSYGDCMLIV